MMGIKLLLPSLDDFSYSPKDLKYSTAILFSVSLVSPLTVHKVIKQSVPNTIVLILSNFDQANDLPVPFHFFMIDNLFLTGLL